MLVRTQRIHLMIMLTFTCNLDRGQGLNNAIEDAYRIVQAIMSVAEGSKALETAITEYESEMIPRGSKEVQLSLEQAWLSHDWDTLTQSPYFRDTGMHKVENIIGCNTNAVTA